MRTGKEEMFRLFQRRDSLGPAHRRKIIEKRVEIAAMLEVVEQGLRGNPCTHEDRGTPKYFRVGVNGGGCGHML